MYLVGLNCGLKACCQQLVAFSGVPLGKISWVPLQRLLKEDYWKILSFSKREEKNILLSVLSTKHKMQLVL